MCTTERVAVELTDAVAVVTGGASGLGYAAARRLHARGATVVLLDLSASDGGDAAARLGDRAHFVSCDVSATGQVADAIRSVENRYGALHVCVNAAGIPDGALTVAADGTPFPMEIFRRVIDVNLIGTFDVLRHAAVVMIRNTPGPDGERGVIINVSSAVAGQGQRGQLAYAASKAGVAGMMLPAARDLAPQGIRVVTLAPGIFHTAMAAALPEEVMTRLQQHALYPARAGDPDEFAALLCHVVENRYLNASTLAVDAGFRLG